MGSALGSLGDFLGNKLNELKKALSNGFNGLSNTVNNVMTSIIGTFEWLWGVLKTSLDTIGSTLSNIWGFFSDFFTTLIDFVVSVFVPSDTFWQKKTALLYDTLVSKFPWVNTMKNMFGVGLTEPSRFSIGFIGDTVISFDWYLPYRVFIKGIMASFFGILGLFYIIKRLRVQFVNNG